ncbi:MAG: hypothetical protein OEW29_13125, partial [Acidimicrobiia bacterium]|nr:hypothetical protein [Acidimicrobiia bacterium]
MTRTGKTVGLGVWSGLALAVAGTVFADGAVLTTAYRGSSPVSDEQLSFPWGGATAVATSVVWGSAQILFTIGLIVFSRSPAITNTRGRRGALVAVAGSILYTVAHAVSVVAHDAKMDDAPAMVALTLFGLGTILVAAGMLVAGIDVARSRVWSGWRRFSPAVLGAWMLVMVPLQFTVALVGAVAVYAAATAALGVALIVETVTACEGVAPASGSWRSPA